MAIAKKKVTKKVAKKVTAKKTELRKTARKVSDELDKLHAQNFAKLKAKPGPKPKDPGQLVLKGHFVPVKVEAKKKGPKKPCKRTTSNW